MAQCHQELLLDLNADCSEFCSSPGHQDWLAVGTYQLHEASSTRHGRLYLYSLQQQQQQQEWIRQLQQLATLDVPGIFDLQWVSVPAVSAAPSIGLALADGTLRLVTVSSGAQHAAQEQQQQQHAKVDCVLPQDEQQMQPTAAAVLQEACSCQAVTSGMALALDWSWQQQKQQQQQDPQQQQQQQQILGAVSSSAGTISIVQVAEAGLQKVAEWRAHELEAWMAHWDRHQRHVLYSGADDCTFKGWDTRTPCSSSSSSSTADEAAPQQAPTFSNRRAHGAGVCCISSHPRRPQLLVTGSYDEAVRLWDVRMATRPVETCQVPTGGGVWRLKWHPTNDRLLLAACMYNGFALVAADESWSSLAVVEEYKGHDSIAYGADWYKGPPLPATPSAAAAAATSAAADDICDKGGALLESQAAAASAQLGGLTLNPAADEGKQQRRPQDVVATCSFYDRRLHLWSPGGSNCCQPAV
ncbi:WD40-repeat-containing domain protein [Scenedesmus sp. NREL 46B-D3]|nr:WD40-repeat-containing domain protein [Scenedesmus sp. NREL 46B-D3]